MMLSIRATFLFLALLLGMPLRSDAQAVNGSDETLKPIAPANGEVLNTFLTATVSWQYPIREKISIDGHQDPYWPYEKVHLRVSPEADRAHPVVDIDLPENITRWRFPVLPDHKYVWQLTPGDRIREYPENGFERTFVSASPHIDETTDSSKRYHNPRRGAHFVHMRPVEMEEDEPLSPWYDVKAYTAGPMPSFGELKPKLPRPIFEGHPEVLDMYWYAWRTFIEVWNFAPEASDHQAVANINGDPAWGMTTARYTPGNPLLTWGPWGSSVLWDNSAMMLFARYGDQAYPFIKQYDNAYARQHENGFICMEVDSNNHEVYPWYPVVVPPLLSMAEWKYYVVSGDLSRLKRVFLPIVKNYEWWMTYMRRPDGSYWKQGLTEEERLTNRDDGVMNYAVGANSFQAVEALYLAKIAGAIGRPDMEQFFSIQHQSIGDLVNARYWDGTHRLYNDRSDPKHPVLAFSNPKDTGKFVTELLPGALYKPIRIFWPLFAQIVPKDRQGPLVQELMNPASFNRPDGIPNLSADSAGYEQTNASIGGAWPIEQFPIREALKAIGRGDLARELADKYFNGFVTAFSKEKTIRESILADTPQFSGAQDFVGWGGVAPIADLIEYVLGFDINVPGNTITWHIERTERHGIESLRFGNFQVSLVCESRSSAAESANISVTSGGSFELKVEFHGKTVSKRIDKGVANIRLP
jgi:hypothetical protein